MIPAPLAHTYARSGALRTLGLAGFCAHDHHDAWLQTGALAMAPAALTESLRLPLPLPLRRPCSISGATRACSAGVSSRSHGQLSPRRQTSPLDAAKHKPRALASASEPCGESPAELRDDEAGLSGRPSALRCSRAARISALILPETGLWLRLQSG